MNEQHVAPATTAGDTLDERGFDVAVVVDQGVTSE